MKISTASFLSIRIPRLLLPALTAWALLSSPCALAADVAGTYVGQDGRSVYLVQVVETQRQRWTGRIEQSALQNDGQIAVQSAPVGGVINGNTLTATLNQRNLDMGVAALASTFRVGVLHLTSRNGGTDLFRADEATYRARVAALRTQAAH